MTCGAEHRPLTRGSRLTHARIEDASVKVEDEAAVKRLARCVLRPPVSLERMAWDGLRSAPPLVERWIPPQWVPKKGRLGLVGSPSSPLHLRLQRWRRNGRDDRHEEELGCWRDHSHHCSVSLSEYSSGAQDVSRPGPSEEMR